MDDESLKRFFDAARARKPDTSRVEFGFETRLLARIREGRGEQAPWFAWAWRLCPVFAALALALGVWSHYSSGDLSNSVAQQADDLLCVEYFTGNQI